MTITWSADPVSSDRQPKTQIIPAEPTEQLLARETLAVLQCYDRKQGIGDRRTTAADWRILKKKKPQHYPIKRGGDRNIKACPAVPTFPNMRPIFGLMAASETRPNLIQNIIGRVLFNGKTKVSRTSHETFNWRGRL